MFCFNKLKMAFFTKLLLLANILLMVTGRQFRVLESENQVVNCTNSGSVCSNKAQNCDKVYICLHGDNNSFFQVEYTCPDGQNCYDGECSTELNNFCLYADKDFECVSKVGTYPEPSDCKKFNFCVPKENENVPSKISARCDDGYGYNYLSTFCDRPLKNNECSSENQVVPTCYTLGQNGPLEENPVYFYVCLHYSDSDLRMYPYVHMCPNGKKYKKDMGCI